VAGYSPEDIAKKDFENEKLRKETMMMKLRMGELAGEVETLRMTKNKLE
jgi:hypothetical protein